MLFVLDNYDSFTYNLVQYCGELGEQPVVYRNDQITVDQVLALKPAAAVLSPGPGTPEKAGILVPLVRSLAGQVPVLGVCLGHQAIAQAFGGRVIRADRLMHGKTCPVQHQADELFEGIPSPFTAMRYHSLVVDWTALPHELIVTAWSGDRGRGGGASGGAGGEIMAMKHRHYPVYGVQFHPESIGTASGKQLLSNFLGVAHAVA